MSEVLFELIRSLRGQGYSLYCALRQTLGTQTAQAFRTWWSLIPRRARRKIKDAWRYHTGTDHHTAYRMFLSLQDVGTISSADFDSWWQLIPEVSRGRILLCWWFFLKQGCHAVHVTRVRGTSEAVISVRLTPGEPLVMY